MFAGTVSCNQVPPAPGSWIRVRVRSTRARTAVVENKSEYVTTGNKENMVMCVCTMDNSEAPHFLPEHEHGGDGGNFEDVTIDTFCDYVIWRHY